MLKVGSSMYRRIALGLGIIPTIFSIPTIGIGPHIIRIYSDCYNLYYNPYYENGVEMRPGEAAAEWLFYHGIGEPWVGGNPPHSRWRY